MQQIIDGDGYVNLGAIRDFGISFNKAMRVEKAKVEQQSAQDLIDEL